MKIIIKQLSSRKNESILYPEIWAIEMWEKGKLFNAALKKPVRDPHLQGGNFTNDTLVRTQEGFYVHCIMDIPNKVYRNFGEIIKFLNTQYGTDIYVHFLEPIKCTVLA